MPMREFALHARLLAAQESGSSDFMEGFWRFLGHVRVPVAGCRHWDSALEFVVHGLGCSWDSL